MLPEKRRLMVPTASTVDSSGLQNVSPETFIERIFGSRGPDKIVRVTKPIQLSDRAFRRNETEIDTWLKAKFGEAE
jgi:hypothetical protein